MIHVETTKEGMTSVEAKGSNKELMAELTGVMHTLRESFEKKYGERVARVMLKAAFKLAFDDKKINEKTIPNEGFDGGAQ